jgi:prophage regulatory protein
MKITGKKQSQKMVRVKQVTAMTSLSAITIWRYEKAGIFPKRRQLGPRAVGWVESEVLEWMETRSPVVSDEKGVLA